MRNYKDKPSKALMQLRKANAFYESALKNLVFPVTMKKWERKEWAIGEIQSIQYHHNPSMTYAKNDIIKHIKTFL